MRSGEKHVELLEVVKKQAEDRKKKEDLRHKVRALVRALCWDSEGVQDRLC